MKYNIIWLKAQLVGKSIYVFIIQQKFVTGVNDPRPQSCDSNANCYQETTGTFPSFKLKKGVIADLGYLNFGGSMLGNLESHSGR